jgi:hypothetical protein
MHTMKRMFVGMAALLGMLTLVSGCTDVSVRAGVPDYLSKLAVPTFQNRTNQPNLSNEVTQELTQDFLVDGRVDLVDPDKATSVLEGTIVQYLLEPLLLDVHNTPQQYKMRIILRLSLKDKGGKAIWTEDSFEDSTTYYVSNSLGIPPEDEQIARRRLIQQLCRKIVTRTIEGF